MVNDSSGVVPVGAYARSRSRRHRFLVLSSAALAVVGTTMGVSFLGSSGVSTIGITPGNSNLVYPLSPGASSPMPAGLNPLTTTAFSGFSTLTGCTSGTITSGTTSTAQATAASGYNCTNSGGASANTVTAAGPSWSPPASGASTVTKAGDLAVVDATGAQNYVTVNLYITNLAALLIDYSAFALPLDVYQTTCVAASGGNSCAAWTQSSNVVSTTSYGAFLTDTVPEMTFVLPKGFYYDIVMEGTNHTVSSGTYSPSTAAPAAASISGIGGSLGVIGNLSGGALGPSFFFTATAQ